MLRDLVQQARSGGTSAELEAVTAERDFFREKYAEQIDAMEVMKGQLKESQRIIDKLRGQVLDLELEKSGMVEQSKGTPKQIKTPKSIQSSGGSTDTSVTALSYDDDLTTKSGAEASVEPVPVSEAADADGPVASVASPRSAQKAEEQEGAQDVDSPEDDDEQSAPAPDVDSDEEEEDEESGSEDDEADNIRAKAERMLMWANYQSSKRSTPNTSMIRDEDDDDDKSKTETERPTPSKVVSDAIVYSLPTSLDERQNNLTDDDDDSTLGSSSRHHNPERSVGSWRSGANSGAGSSGKMGNLFNNLRDMIDPPSESEIDSESDEE